MRFVITLGGRYLTAISDDLRLAEWGSELREALRFQGRHEVWTVASATHGFVSAVCSHCDAHELEGGPDDHRHVSACKSHSLRQEIREAVVAGSSGEAARLRSASTA